MKKAQADAERAWEILVALVMETRRKVNEVSGLPFSRVRALRRLEGEPRTLSDLAYAMSVDAPAATVVVNDLEARGLVKRKAHPENRRSKLVMLTAEGRRIVDAVNNIDDKPPVELTRLSAKDLAELRRIVETMAPND